MHIHRMDSFQPPPEESGSEIPDAESPESVRLSASPDALGKASLPDSPSGRDAAESEPGHTRSPRAGDAVCQGRLMNSHVTNHRPADKDLHLPQRHGEASAISSVRTLVSAQAMFYHGDLDQSGAPDYATESQPLGSHSGLIDEVLGEGSRSAQPMEAAPPPSQVRQTGSDSGEDDGPSKGTKKPGSS